MFRPKQFTPAQLEDTPVQYDSPQDVSAQENSTSTFSTHDYEGSAITDLADVGFQTISLLRIASKNIIDKPRFNVPLLEATPLSAIIFSMGGKQIGENLQSGQTFFSVLNQEISVKENKWYNKTRNKGHVNAISLVKHLLATEENIDEQENQRTLFIAACKKITAIQNEVQNLKEVSEHPASEVKSSNEKSETTVEKIEKHEPIIAKPEYKKIDWKALTDQLNMIPLSSVMEYIGASPNEDKHRGQWKVWATGHNVQVTGNQWFDYNEHFGKVGAITLLAFHLSIVNNINYKVDENRKNLRTMAIKELMKEFGSDFETSALGSVEINFKQPFSMPHVIDFKLKDVKNYLHEKRGIPQWIINKQIATGNLFAGFPSDWKMHPHLKNPEKLDNGNVWAVMLGSNGNAAEMRCIGQRDNYAKVLATGSDKESGGFLIKAEKDCSERTVSALEAAIDAMSYHAFYPGRVATSCMGVNFNLALTSSLEALNAGYKFQLCFDNDLAGNEATVRFREKLIEEIGEDSYREYTAQGKISFFDLGIKILKETIKNNDIFYFDVKNNETGKEAVLLFQEQLANVMPKEEIKHLLNKGKIKYINVSPAFGIIQDPKLEARQVVDLLETGKPYYLRIRADDDEKEDIKSKRIAFEEAMLDISSHKTQQWQKEGKLIFKKDALAKDWNEFFLYMKSQPEFNENLKQQENHYSGNVQKSKMSNS